MYKGGRGLTWRIMIAVLTEWRDYTIRGNVNGLSSDLSWHFPYFFNDLNDYWWYLGSLESSSCGFKFQATLMSKQASCNITTLICFELHGILWLWKAGFSPNYYKPDKETRSCIRAHVTPSNIKNYPKGQKEIVLYFFFNQTQ